MADRDFSIVLEITGTSAGIDEAIAKVKQLGLETKVSGGAVAQAGQTAAAATSALGAAMAELASGLLIGAVAGAFYGIVSAVQETIAFQVHLTEEIRQQSAALEAEVPKWFDLADAAQKFSDVVKLGDRITDDLAAARARFDAFRAQELAAWQKFVDAIVVIFSTVRGLGAGPNAGALAAGNKASAEALGTVIDHAIAATQSGEANVADAARLRAEPVGKAIEEVTAKVASFREQITQLDARIHPPQGGETNEQLIAIETAIEARGKVNDKLQIQLALAEELNKKQGAQTESARKTADTIEILTAKRRQDNEAIAEAAGQKAYDEEIKAKRALGLLDTDAVAKAEQIRQLTHDNTLAQLEQKSASEGTRDAHRDIVAFLREESALLAASRQRQQLVEQNPLLSDGQKNIQLAQIIGEQIGLINDKIEEGKAKLAGGTLDPETYIQVSKAVQDLQFQADLLGQRLGNTSFIGQLQAQFAALDSQMELTGAKIGKLFTGTLQTSINGVSQAITGLITKSSTFHQAWNSAIGSIIGSWVQLGVETAAYYALLLAKWVIARIAASAHRSADVTEHVAAEGVKAGASGISALLTSISSYGWAAIVGLAAVVAALAYFASSGFAAGGYTGDGGGSQVAGVVHAGEYVLSARAVANLGVSNLDVLHDQARSGLSLDNLAYSSRAPRFEAGGYVNGGFSSESGGGALSSLGGLTILNAFDTATIAEAVLNHPIGKKLVLNHVRGERISLGFGS